MLPLPHSTSILLNSKLFSTLFLNCLQAACVALRTKLTSITKDMLSLTSEGQANALSGHAHSVVTILSFLVQRASFAMTKNRSGIIRTPVPPQLSPTRRRSSVLTPDQRRTSIMTRSSSSESGRTSRVDLAQAAVFVGHALKLENAIALLQEHLQLINRLEASQVAASISLAWRVPLQYKFVGKGEENVPPSLVVMTTERGFPYGCEYQGSFGQMSLTPEVQQSMTAILRSIHCSQLAMCLTKEVSEECRENQK